MVLNKAKYLVFAGLFCLLSGLQAQRFELGLSAYPGLAHNQGFEAGMNGISLNFRYLFTLEQDLVLSGGLEAGYSGWGSQLLFPLGICYGRAHLIGARLLNGMALYRQGPQWVGGLELYYGYVLFREKKHQLILSAGLRYIAQPAYRAYGPIYSYFDLPLGISWRFGQ